MEVVSPRHYCITIDVDWAPDFMIDAVAEQLIAAGVKATWFVTHPSDAIDRLKSQPDLFELGIHPNFHAGSTQGRRPAEIIEYCLSIVPHAASVRTHGLLQSTNLLVALMEQPRLRFEASLMTPGLAVSKLVEFWWKRRCLLRVPLVWEDDLEMQCEYPSWVFDAISRHPGRLIGLSFHPVHIYLNSCDLEPYLALKSRRLRLQEARLRDVAGLVNRGEGAGSLFQNLLRELSGTRKSVRIDELEQLMTDDVATIGLSSVRRAA